MNNENNLNTQPVKAKSNTLTNILLIILIASILGVFGYNEFIKKDDKKVDNENKGTVEPTATPTEKCKYTNLDNYTLTATDKKELAKLIKAKMNNSEFEVVADSVTMESKGYYAQVQAQTKQNGTEYGPVLALVYKVGNKFEIYDYGTGFLNTEIDELENLTNKACGVEPKPTPAPTFDLSKFDGTKAINGTEEYGYQLNYTNDYTKQGLTVAINDDKKSVTLTIDWNTANDNITGGRIIDGGIKTYTATFTQEVKKAVIDGYGHDFGYESILYLLKDGTVKYTPIKEFLKNDTTSSMMVKDINISGIVEITSAVTYPINQYGIGGYYTPIAIKADGTFYDLGQIFLGMEE